MANRMVVLLCGPPGAGKTTAARGSGLKVYDRDDPEWMSERQFRMKIAELARDPHARAVVIRAGASSSARGKATELIGATHTYLLIEERQELAQRIISRNRADKITGLASIKTWFNNHDRDDRVPDFPGWAAIESGAPGVTSEDW